MVRVKICGMTRAEDVDAAIMGGADAVGFIVGFPSSPRNLTVDYAAGLARRVGPFVDAVLVTTTDVVKNDLAKVKALRPDAIQLYGDSISPGDLRGSLGVRLIRPYLLKSTDPADAKRAVDGFDALLTDTYVAGAHGGTGRTSDWAVCADVKSAIAPTPLVLSGGLNPQNVEEAVRRVRPFAVDVSSGVESSPGVKDHHKVSAFIRMAKEAD
jgi:phosphoribosylanthranilate isomerase